MGSSFIAAAADGGHNESFKSPQKQKLKLIRFNKKGDTKKIDLLRKFAF